MQLTFISADTKLAKNITDKGIKPYPLVKNVSSHTVDVFTLQDFANTLKKESAKGHALFRGKFNRDLNNESRAGKWVQHLTEWCVLDIDGLDAPISVPTTGIDEKTLQLIGAQVSALLPEPFNKSSFIIQASSKQSLVNDGKVHAHLFFLLDTPISADGLTNAFTNANFSNKTLEENIRLAKSGFTLCYPLDICTAQLSRIIFIAPPSFNGQNTKDPFLSSDDRIAIVQKTNGLLPVAELDTSSPETKVQKKIVELRKAQGLPPREKPHYQQVTYDGVKHHVLLNATPGTLVHAYTARGFVYYNLNGGDSAAYYHPEGKPEYIFNFKGEPIFRFEQVDPVSYAAYCQANRDLIIQNNPIHAFACLSDHDDVIYRVYHDIPNNDVRLIRTKRENIADFYAAHGQIWDKTLPLWLVEFNPSAKYVIDYSKQKINTFVETKYMKTPDQYDQQTARHFTYGNARMMETFTPNIAKLMLHVLGNDITELNHFINWLAFIWQNKKKPGTAWIFSGTEGTGKGIMQKHILSPLFGKEQVALRLNNDLDDTFTGWRKNKLLVIVDEFEMRATSKQKRNIAQLKNWITETRSSLRFMHQGASNEDVYDNYIMFTNVHGSIEISEGDRRWNVATRQEIPLKAKHPDIPALIKGVEKELFAFAGFLEHWLVDEALAKTPMENHEKQKTRKASMNAVDAFISALFNGEMDYFIDIMDMNGDSPTEAMMITTAQAIIGRWMYDEDESYATTDELAKIYNVLNKSNISSQRIGRFLSQRGKAPERIYTNGSKSRKRGVKFRMHSLLFSKEELKDMAPNTVKQFPKAKAVGK